MSKGLRVEILLDKLKSDLRIKEHELKALNVYTPGEICIDIQRRMVLADIDSLVQQIKEIEDEKI